MLQQSFGLGPSADGRKTSEIGVKNYFCMRRYDELSNFSRDHVDFPSEVDAA